MPQGSFSATVSKWVAETKQRQTAVFRESAQRVIEVAQTPIAAGGNMPVDSGFLRASGAAVIGSNPPPLREKPAGDGKHTFDMGDVALVLAGATATDTITFVYTAKYARPQEYGARGRDGRRFVGLAAQQWPRIVREVAAEARARSS
jgi:hypothetical protein